MPTDDERLAGDVPPGAPLRFACECGHRAEYARAARVTFLHFHASADQFTADCPGCDTARPAQVLKGAFTDQLLTCVSTGHFIDDPNAEPTGEPRYWDSTTVDFANALSPIEMAADVFIIRCAGCDALLSKADRREGPGAPEVGYEYYECPDCDHRTHPSKAEVTTP